jgi:hypothetical protein
VTLTDVPEVPVFGVARMLSGVTKKAVVASTLDGELW